MKFKQIILRHMKMTLVNPFTTSFGTQTEKEFILVEIKNNQGLSGWGESVALTEPLYKEETLKTNWIMMEDFLIPMLLDTPLIHPENVSEIFKPIKGNFMAKSALEGAVWDLYAKENHIPLYKALGGTKKKVEVGISIGIQNSVEELLQKIRNQIKDGYKRIKIKIKPGWDIDIVEQVRKHFPNISLMVDANSAYTLDDANHLKVLDKFNLMMIEQPLAYDDIIDHAELQSILNTPICLDESIHSVDTARKAIKLGSCKIINIKIGRVGGLTEAKKIHDFCKNRQIPVWCGGMLETGIGRAHNVAIATLNNFLLPGDTAASSKYWRQDIIEPAITVENGYIKVSEKPGIGYLPNINLIDEFSIASKTFKP